MYLSIIQRHAINLVICERERNDHQFKFEEQEESWVRLLIRLSFLRAGDPWSKSFRPDFMRKLIQSPDMNLSRPHSVHVALFIVVFIIIIIVVIIFTLDRPRFVFLAGAYACVAEEAASSMCLSQ